MINEINIHSGDIIRLVVNPDLINVTMTEDLLKCYQTLFPENSIMIDIDKAITSIDIFHTNDNTLLSLDKDRIF